MADKRGGRRLSCCPGVKEVVEKGWRAYPASECQDTVSNIRFRPARALLYDVHKENNKPCFQGLGWGILFFLQWGRKSIQGKSLSPTVVQVQISNS